eukprot:2371405-Pleurochrysis_carterae.AAC.1
MPSRLRQQRAPPPHTRHVAPTAQRPPLAPARRARHDALLVHSLCRARTPPPYRPLLTGLPCRARSAVAR